MNLKTIMTGRKLFLAIALWLTCLTHATTINLPTTIWNKCRNGADSLSALAEFHKRYVNKDVTIVYPRNHVVHLSITEKAQTIGLSKQTDFNGCTFVVDNRSKNHYLFAIVYPETTAKPIEISKKDIDKGDFSKLPVFQNNRCLLLIKDRNPWVKNRKGYNYGATRSDILLIEDGKALNQATTLYDTPSSNPECKFLETDLTEKKFANLTFIRSARSTAITNLMLVKFQNNVSIENVSIETPPLTKKQPHEGDYCFNVQNCTNITFHDVTIDGTYSDYNKYGYAISLDNVWNSFFIRLKAKAQWGIFGNYNLNTASLEDCDINRFDIHCYGRDITFKNCTFRNTLNDTNTYNQFSSVFGTILFEGCRFERFCPVLQEPSFNAYTGYDLLMNNCYMEADERHNCIIQAGMLEAETNSRPELKEKCWPNVSINGLTLKTNDVSDFYIFNPMAGNTYKGKIGHLSNISINGLQLIPANSTINIIESSLKISTRKRMKRNYTLPNRIKIQKRL